MNRAIPFTCLMALALLLLLFAPAVLPDEVDESSGGEQSDAATRVSDTTIELSGGAFNDVLKPEYRRELGISDKQAAKITEIKAKLSNSFRELRDAGPGGRRGEEREAQRRNFDEVRREHPKKLMAVLSLDQRQRLFEIQLQRGGFSILTDPYIAKRLDVTAEQHKKIGESCRVLQEKGAVAFESARSDPEGMRKKMKAIQAQHEKNMGEVLTAEQRAMFRTLQGEPFKFPTDDSP